MPADRPQQDPPSPSAPPSGADTFAFLSGTENSIPVGPASAQDSHPSQTNQPEPVPAPMAETRSLPRIDDRPPSPTDPTRDLVPNALPAPATDVLRPAGSAAVTQPVRPLPSVPGYDLLGVLGEGGMGVVYRARQRGLNRLVALKMILGGSAIKSDQLARFRLEAEAVARLSHPNIVQIFDTGDTDGTPYFSLELLTGGSLDSRLKKSPQPAGDSARLVSILARAMHAAHTAGIIHRDLKPANVLFSGDGTPKITDFGLAKEVSGDSTGQTSTGHVMGSPPYMSPEQAKGDSEELGPPTDIYALGAVLYEMLTGRPPFLGKNPMETVLQVIMDDPVAPMRRQPTVPRDLDTICLKCLSKRPTDRYATGADLADDLDRFVAGEPIRARPLSRVERLSRWAAKRRWLVAAGVVLLVGVGAFGADAWNRQRVRAAEVARVSAEQTQALDRAEHHLAAGHVTEGIDEAGRVLQAVGTDPEFGSLRERAEGLYQRGRDEQTRAEAVRKNRAEAAAVAERFRRLADDAAFLVTGVPGIDDPDRLNRLRTAAGAGLACWTEAANGATAWLPLVDALGPNERATVRAQCAELIAATADAEPDPKAALAVLGRAEELGLETSVLCQHRAVVLERLGRHDEAEAARGRARSAAAAEADPNAPPERQFARLAARRSEGEAAFRDGRLDDAEAAFSDVLARQRTNVWSRYGFMLCRLKRRAFEDVIARCDELLEQQPGFAWARIYRGRARAELASAAAARPETRAKADALRKLAEDDLTTALKSLAPPPADRLARYAVLVYQGLLREQTDRVAATAVLRSAVAVWPDEPAARLSLAALYQTAGNLDAAAAELTAVLRYSPDHLEARRRSARLAVARGDMAGALDELNKAFALPGADVAARVEDRCLAGQLRQRLKQWPAAEAEFRAALGLNPNHPASLRGLGDFQYSQAQTAPTAADRTRLYEAAIAAYEKIERAGPAGIDAALLRRRGYAKGQLRQIDGAIQDYTRSLELEPDADTFARRGWAVLRGQESARKALADFEAAIKLRADVGDWHVGRALCLAKLGGHQAEAAKSAAEGLSLGPPAVLLSYNAARVYAVCAAAAVVGKGMTDRQSAEARERYLTSGINALERALEQTPAADRVRYWRDTVKVDPDLRPLRSSPKYHRLETTYGGGS